MSRLLIGYLAFINALAFLLYGLDKLLSKSKARRIPERTLLWLARLGGGMGCWLGMTVFRHKTKHDQFKKLVPLWTMIWIVVLGMLLFLIRKGF